MGVGDILYMGISYTWKNMVVIHLVLFLNMIYNYELFKFSLPLVEIWQIHCKLSTHFT